MPIPSIWSLLLGLSLEGSYLGMSIENKTSLQEFGIIQRAYLTKAISIPFGTEFTNYTRTSRMYSDDNLKQLIFSAKTYAKNDFEFLGADWDWGLGGGLKLALNNKKVQLVDSTEINALYSVSLYPTISSYAAIYFDKDKSDGIRFILDMDASFPAGLEAILSFKFNLD